MSDDQRTGGAGAGAGAGGGHAGLSGSPPAVNGWNADYIEAQYEAYRRDPMSLPADVRAFFAGYDLAADRGAAPGASGGPAPGASGTSLDSCAERLTDAYRQHGHLEARRDPLGEVRAAAPQLSLSASGLSEDDLDRPLSGGGTVRELLERLRSAYCRSIGVEFWHCETPRERAWFIERFERETWAPTKEQRASILRDITASETLERWLAKRYPGKKRFSIEGGEALIPMLKKMTDRAGGLGVREIIMGMAHRGRLNVLRHYLGKDTERLITEFEDSWVGMSEDGGDVKYHRGYSTDQQTPAGPVHLSLLNNPSHLESVNPLVLGKARAKQDAAGEGSKPRYLPLTIHGDAALSGQGVVAECLNMCRLEGYDVGGCVHLVINNQVGFTTDPSDGRSTYYCTDIAKFVHAPVLHVNGDDPEACVRAAMVAVEYRQEFGRDVFVDLCCFRRHGHNETDEPAYTQPGMYTAVRAHPGTRSLYAAKLAAEGAVTTVEAEAMVEGEITALDAAQDSARKTPVKPVTPPGGGAWAGIEGGYSFDGPSTGVPLDSLAKVCGALGRVPEGFAAHPKLRGLMESRSKLATPGARVSHADAELLAIGSLLAEGTSARLSGQDCRRGTFSQRHAVYRDEKSNERFTPLNGVASGGAALRVWDSPLSEYGVMGFEYGYSRSAPGVLTMWEAQFGDFCNTAQVIIDQYMAASEAKWERWCGLVLLLPHGQEGQGPEHSSARLERFLQLCAEHNMEVVYPTTGAQMFHVLRRQVRRGFRKPLIVMTPKKFLRIETSGVEDLTRGSFRCLIDDEHVTDPSRVSRVIYCTGKVYHDLHEKRLVLGSAVDAGVVAMVRVEQLYPFHTELAKAIDGRYPASAERVWVQEEPRNQGAYLYIADVMRERMGVSLRYMGRAASPTPATGSEASFKKSQEALVTAAVTPPRASSAAPTPNPTPTPTPPPPSPAGRPGAGGAGGAKNPTGRGGTGAAKAAR